MTELMETARGMKSECCKVLWETHRMCADGLRRSKNVSIDPFQGLFAVGAKAHCSTMCHAALLQMSSPPKK